MKSLATLLIAAVFLSGSLAWGQPWGGRDGGEGSRWGGRGEGEGRRGGRGGDDQDRSARLEGFLRSLDANQDGVLELSEVPEERRGMLQFFAGRMGLDASKPIAISQIRDAVANRSSGGPPGGPPPSSGTPQKPEDKKNANTGPPLVPGFGSDDVLPLVPGFGERVAALGATAAPPGGDRRDDRRGSPDEDDEADDEEDGDEENSPARKSYRFRSPRERLPEGLPSWFSERDKNGDGQVAMGEYAEYWSDETAEEFLELDHNGDGVLTPRECLTPVPSETETASAESSPESGAAPSPPPAPGASPPAPSGGETPWWMR